VCQSPAEAAREEKRYTEEETNKIVLSRERTPKDYDIMRHTVSIASIVHAL
jgi:hypothetical protein